MPAADYRKKPIFILGIDRSGTSMLSEVIHRWGAHAGKEEHLPQADESNPQGYWEYAPMQELIGGLIDSLGVSIWAHDFKERLQVRITDPHLEARALELALGMGNPDRPWFWKDALLISVIPLLRRIFPEAVYLVTLRDPHASAVSYEKMMIPKPLRDKIRLVEYTYLRWQHFMLTILEELRGYEGQLLVPYETLVSSPGEQCARISRFLDARYPLPGDPKERIDKMARTIDPQLWRNRSRVPFLEREDAPGAQKKLFAYLENHLDTNFGDFDPRDHALPEWAREYCANMGVIGWMLNSL
jgi:hypothetical protein